MKIKINVFIMIAFAISCFMPLTVFGTDVFYTYDEVGNMILKSGDDDNDGLTNTDAVIYGTDPQNEDTDDDGMLDGWEVLNGLNPLYDDANNDPDNDGVSNYDESLAGTNPNMPYDLILANDTVSTGVAKAYQAENSITAGPAYIIESGSNVSLEAGNIITLKPGFSANDGSTFNASVVQTNFTVPVVTENILLGNWEFEDGSGSVASDSSGNGSHGTVNGGAAWTTTGKVGGALDFDGVDDYVDIGDIDLTDAFTIAAWIKLSSTGKYTIVGKSYSTYQFIVTSTGNLVFSRNTSSGISYNAGLAINTWYHVAVTFNTTDGMVMYLNGSAVAADSDITTTATNNTPTKIGARAWTAKDFFHGILDEVHVYDTALTALEVQDLVGNNNVGYMAHFALEGNADDSSGNGNHGTVNGGAVWTATGKVGGALDLDGVDDYVDIGDVDLTDAFTIAAWIKLSSTGQYTIVGKSYSTYQFIVSSTGNLVFHRNSSSGIWYGAGLAIDTWYHVAVTFNTTDGMVLYCISTVAR